METKAERTKGIWKVKKPTEGNGGGAFSISTDDWNIATVWNCGDGDDAQANAAYICTAVNHHEEMKTVIIELQKQFNKDGNMTGHLYEMCENILAKLSTK